MRSKWSTKKEPTVIFRLTTDDVEGKFKFDTVEGYYHAAQTWSGLFIDGEISGFAGAVHGSTTLFWKAILQKASCNRSEIGPIAPRLTTKTKAAFSIYERTNTALPNNKMEFKKLIADYTNWPISHAHRMTWALPTMTKTLIFLFWPITAAQNSFLAETVVQILDTSLVTLTAISDYVIGDTQYCILLTILSSKKYLL